MSTAKGLRPTSLALLMALLLTASTAAHAQPLGGGIDLAEEADLRFQVGVEAYRGGRYLEALEHLLTSNRLAPNHNVAFNVARCYEQLGRFSDAYRHYADFHAAETTPAGRAEGQRALDRIRPQVALVEISSTPPGASIFLDRRDLGSRGLTPRILALTPGPHRVLLEAAGHDGAESVELVAVMGKTAVVSLTLSRILGQVVVSGEPAGAVVTVEQGSTQSDDGRSTPPGLPATLSLGPGPVVLQVSASGHRTERFSVNVESRRSLSLTVNLPRLTGALVIDADEVGALVEFDGRASGFTPVVVEGVTVGEHALRIVSAGFHPFETRVRIEVDERVAVSAPLRPVYEVTAASRVTESADTAPASVTLISREEIRAFGFETLYDALGGVRGVFQTDDLTYQTIGVRGFSRPGDYGNHLLVLMDGHTMNDDLLGSSYMGHDFQSDLGDVRRIEVVRGPGSALYGSNAFFGVIHVVTHGDEALPRPHVGLAAYGDGVGRARLGLGHRFGEGNAMYLSAAVSESRGDDYDFPELRTPSLSIPAHDGRSLGSAGHRGATLNGKAWMGPLTLHANYNLREKRYPTGTFETLLADEEAVSKDYRGFVEVRFEPRLSESVGLFSRAYIDTYSTRGGYPYAPPPDDVGVLRDTWDGLWTGAELRLRAELGALCTLTAGAEGRVSLRADLISEDELGRNLDEDAKSQVASAYLVADARPLTALTLSLGARVDHFSTFGNTLSPRLAAVWQTSSASTLKAIVGQAFRAASPYERLYHDGGQTQIAAAGLQPATVRTAELEYSHLVLGDYRAIAGVYVNQIDQFIEQVARLSPTAEAPDATVIQYQNLKAPTQTVGAELELRREWRQGGMLSASYAFQRTRLDGVLTDDRITNSPEHLVGLKWAVPVGRTGATLANRLRLESGRLTEAGQDTGHAVLWDVHLTADVPTAHLSYGLGLRNLFDVRPKHPVSGEFAPLDEVPQSGRTLLATATFTL